MSTDFPGDLTSGFSEPVPNAVRDLIPPDGLLFDRGDLIPPSRPEDGDGPSWLPPEVETGPVRSSSLPRGVVFIAALDVADPWVTIGTLNSEGISVQTTVPDPLDSAQLLAEFEDFASGAVEFRFDGVGTGELRTWGATGSAPAGYRPGRGAEPVDIVNQIDRAVAALCPCGAEPSEEFGPYCSYDCKPTHRSTHTISDRDGTQMRWRPDLVSQVDDTHLTVCLARQRHGRFWVEIFERAGTEMLHVRLDDDHRWVGADLCRDPAEDFEQRYEAKLRALVAELENNRRVDPEQPDNYLYRSYLAEVDEQLRLDQARRERLWGRLRSHRRPRAAADARWAPGTPWAHYVPQFDLEGMGRAIAMECAWFTRAVSPARPEVVDQRESTLRRVRERRNAGPQIPARAPRRIDPRHGR